MEHTKLYQSVKASNNIMREAVRSTKDHEKLREIRTALKRALEIIEEDETHQKKFGLYELCKHGKYSDEYNQFCEQADYERLLLEEDYNNILEECESKIIQHIEDEVFNLPGDRIIALVEYHNKKIQLNNT